MRPQLLSITFFLTSTWAALADQIEFLRGNTITGEVVHIDKEAKRITFDATIGNQKIRRTYLYKEVHRVLYQEKSYILNPKPNLDDPIVNGSITRTPDEVQALIDSVGASLPPWFESTRLQFPATLAISWPNPPDKVWDNQKYPGHYVWDVINPNPKRWREGVRLMHHLVEQNDQNQNAQIKAMNQLGTLYAGFLEDWPRAAYWWQRAGKGSPGSAGAGGFRAGYEVGLAKCYYRLGNREMAVEVLNRTGGTPAIWCELDEHQRALQEAEKARHGWMKEQALIVCGDVCRHAGWYDKALNYYTQATQLPNNDKYRNTIPQAHERIIAMRAEKGFDLSKITDGRYTGQAMGYSGPLYLSIMVRGNKIETVNVTQHIEKQYYSSITDIPQQIVTRQNVQGIDATSGATITAEAIVRAAASALASDPEPR